MKKTASLIHGSREPVINGRKRKNTCCVIVPDEEIDTHLFWLSEKPGRTPFSVALQIAAIRDLQDGADLNA